MYSKQSMWLGTPLWQITFVMKVPLKLFFTELQLTERSGTMADTLLRLFLISAAIVDADNAVLGPQTSSPPLLPVSSFD
jgi:hypothetical protein